MNSNILTTIILTAVVFLFSCKERKNTAEADEHSINDSIIKSITTETALISDDHNEIKLTGKIQANENRMAKVFAMVSGKIQTVHAELGDYVKRGQTLAILKSVEVAGASNDLSLSEANVEMAKKSLQTTQDLYEGKLATEQDYINAKITYNKALSELNRAKQVSAITGGKNATLAITAPINGYIVEKNITNNSEVRQDNNANLFTIADLSDVWVTANVYESDMMNIQLGDSVIVNTLANPYQNYVGKIDKIYNVLDPATRTMKVRISMQNNKQELKPEMFVTVKVNIRGPGKVLSIPAKALVMDNSKYYVIIKKEDKLNVKEINLLKRNEEKAYVQGLSPNDRVVTSSQVFIYQALTSN